MLAVLDFCYHVKNISAADITGFFCFCFFYLENKYKLPNASKCILRCVFFFIIFVGILLLFNIFVLFYLVFGVCVVTHSRYNRER